MARHKCIDTSPRFLPVNLSRQLVLGTFEYALNHLIDNEIDLSAFDQQQQGIDHGFGRKRGLSLVVLQMPDIRLQAISQSQN